MTIGSGTSLKSPAQEPLNTATEDFVVPREPRLHWRMLLPNRRRSHPFASLDAKAVHAVFWARNAIYHGLRALGVAPGESVLVPSFHCAAAVEPILSYGAKVTFYNICRDCSPDFNDIAAKINKQTRAVLAIHYFGFPQPIRAFQELCRAHQLYLIEDCAHVLSGETDGAALGSFGDISIFSWRKFLPLYDGGHLIINNPKLQVDIPWARGNPLFSLKVAKNIFDKLLDDSPSKTVHLLAEALQVPYALARRVLFTSRHRPQALMANNYGLHFDPSLVNVRMSSVSQYITRNLDLAEIVARRRLNYAQLLKAVESLPGLTPIYRHIPEEVCPWVFPVLAHGRRELHTLLRSSGIPAFTWAGVIHPALSVEEFPDADLLYHNLVLLPIHQDIENPHKQVMVDVLRQSLR